MSSPRKGPAYCIESERLVIRCWEPRDAAMLQAAIDASLEHLRRWMPWAVEEPETVEQKAARLRRMRGQFDLDQDFVYGILDREETRALGGTGLHTRVGPNAREIGYWIHAGHEGKGYVTETVLALTRVGFEIEALERIEIHCDPRNARSIAVAERAGYTHEATLRGRDLAPDGQARDTAIWTLFRADYAASPAARAEIRAFDVLGKRLL